jgi:hypothetical protein
MTSSVRKSNRPLALREAAQRSVPGGNHRWRGREVIQQAGQQRKSCSLHGRVRPELLFVLRKDRHYHECCDANSMTESGQDRQNSE